MAAALAVWWRALRHYNHYGYRYVWCNVAWVVCSLPIVTLPAAWMGLVNVSHRLYHGETAGLNEFWEGFKAYFWRGLAMGVLNILVLVINISNLVAYSSATDAFHTVLRTVWLVLLAVWVMLQFYLYPLLLEMKEPTLLGAARNALVMIVLNPIFSVVLLATFAAAFVISYLFVALWLLVTAGVLAAVFTGAVLDRLVAAGMHAPLPDPAGAPEANDPDIT